MAKTIRWGIIGCGNVTEVKSGPGFQKAHNSALVAVMRRNGELAADYAQRHGVPRWYDDAAALIADPEVDAVYVATPPSSHKEYTLMAAAAGKPVYVEKPMAMNHAECQEMIAACEAAGVPLFVAYYRRMLPRFRKIKRLIDDGAIGDVRFVTVRLHQTARPGHFDPENLPWRVIPEIAGGGIFLDLAAHAGLPGPLPGSGGVGQRPRATRPDSIAPKTRSPGVGSTHVGCAQGAGVWCFDSYANVDITEIVGTKGQLTFSSFGEEPVQLTTANGVEEFAISTRRISSSR
ncbi:MAG: Gfo/Idh/MocA family oxidoreductase [Caldilineaceae bacterium]